MDNIHSATPGVWNGVPVSLGDMRDMADNFQQFSSGDNPYYRPFILVNHDDALAGGLVTGARFDGAELHLDGDHIPEPVGAWANGKQLHGASIEFWHPKYDDAGNIVEGFMRPDGTYSPTKVIKSLSLLGNQAPGMKGMSELPTARFSDSTSTGGSAVNRDDLIAALAAQGFDATKLTDLDTLLQYLVDCKAKPGDVAAGVGDPAQAQGVDLNPMPMADLVAGAGGVGGAGGGLAVPSITGGAGAGTPAPTSLTLKFNDSAGKPVVGTVTLPTGYVLAPANGGLTAADRQALAFLAQNGQAVAADMKRQREQSKAQAIKGFGDRMAAANVPPATIKAQQAVLFALPHDVTRKFADGKNSGTALDEAIHLLEAGAIPGRKFDEKIGQGAGGTVTVGAGGQDDKKAAWEERKKTMLANDPVFQKKQRDLAKAGKK